MRLHRIFISITETVFIKAQYQRTKLQTLNSITYFTHQHPTLPRLVLQEDSNLSYPLGLKGEPSLPLASILLQLLSFIDLLSLTFTQDTFVFKDLWLQAIVTIIPVPTCVVPWLPRSSDTIKQCSHPLLTLLHSSCSLSSSRSAYIWNKGTNQLEILKNHKAIPVVRDYIRLRYDE